MLYSSTYNCLNANRFLFVCSKNAYHPLESAAVACPLEKNVLVHLAISFFLHPGVLSVTSTNANLFSTVLIDLNCKTYLIKFYKRWNKLTNSH